ncbi:hypothetical protein FNF28_00696 [Cafeteria roenbergensis]|uniref:SMP-LTD domain-containing protein n=1 Tax=Cafeteria roenbergensis TaxID=33653 RepID=A0A5A8E3C0_CAFRO|nr:hypothetical protein FNF28_00696 [Cafeteria roenbergensis]
MAFNNTTGVPSPSPLSPSPSASPSVNVTLVNITRSELPLVLRPDDPAFPLYVAVWTAIACAVAVMCARGVQYIVGRFVQVMINCCMRLSRSKTRVRLDWAELSMLGGTLVLRGLSVQVPGAVVRIAKANIFVRYWMLGGGASSDAASPPPLAADLDGAEVFLVEAAGTYSRLQQLAAAQRTAKSGGRRGHRPPDTAANTSAAGAGSPADSAAQADAHLPSGVHAETDASGRVFAAADSAEAASVLRETAASTLGELMMLRPDRSRLSTASLLFSFVRVNVRSLRLVVGNHLLPSTAVMSAKDVALLSFVAGTGAAAPRGGGSPARKRSATLDEAGRARSIVNTTARDVTLSIVRNPHFLHVRRTRAQVPSLRAQGAAPRPQACGTASTMHVLTGCARVAGGVQDDTVLVADGLTVESSALTPFRWEEPSLSTLSVSLLRPVWPLSYAHISAFTDLGVGFSAAMAATPTWLSQKELSRRSAGPATPAPAYFQPYSSVTVIRMDAPVLPLAAAPGNVVDTPGDLSETPTATLSLPCLVAQISMDLLEWGQPETAVRFDVLAGLPDPESGEVLCDAGNPMRPMSADTLDMAIGLDSVDLTATPEAVSCLVHALINNILGGSQQPVTSLQAAMTGGQNLETYVTGRTSLVEPVGPAAATAAQAGSWVGRAQGPLRPADWRSGWTGMEVVARVDLRGVRAVVPTQHASDVADADPAGAAADQAFTSLLPEASSGAPVLAAAAPTVIVLCCPLVALQYRGATYGSELTLDVSPASVVLEGPDSGAAAQDDDFAPVQDGSLLLSLEEAQSVSGMAGKPPPSAGARLAQALARQRGRRRAAQRIVPPSPALTMAGAAGLPLLPSWVLQHFREGQVVSVSPKTLGIIVVAYHAGQVFVSAPVRDISSRSKIVLSQGESQAVVGSLTSSLHARTRRLQTGGPDGASLFVDPALLG